MDTSGGFPRTLDSHLSSPGAESPVTLGTREEVIPALLPHTFGIPSCCSLSEEVEKNSKGPDLEASYGFKVQRQPRTSHARQLAFQDEPAVLTEDSPALSISAAVSGHQHPPALREGECGRSNQFFRPDSWNKKPPAACGRNPFLLMAVMMLTPTSPNPDILLKAELLVPKVICSGYCLGWP